MREEVRFSISEAGLSMHALRFMDVTPAVRRGR
jgi:hypothetical protein